MTGEAVRRVAPALLKTFTILLIVFGMVIATVAQGFADRLTPQAADLMHDIYMWYEHYFRALTVILAAFLTYALVKASRRDVSPLRRNSLISLSVVSFLSLIVFPLATGYYELYNALMPFPWSTLPLQLVDSGTFFENRFADFGGVDGASFLLWAYVAYQAVVLGGTLVLGRRWQCSMLCIMNGIHAETLGEALPFIAHDRRRPRSKRIHPRVRWVLRKLQIVVFSVNLVLIAAWVLVLTAEPAFLDRTSLISAERIKYLSVELTLLMLLWVFIGGRGYCYYCPAGFFLGIVGNAVGQKIETGLTRCTGCGACDDACKLSIDISVHARQGRPVTAVQCVGCGLCVEACPTGNLRYTTRILARSRGPNRQVARS